MRSVLRALVVAAPLVAAFAWFVPSGAEQPAGLARPVPPPPPSAATARGLTVSAFPELRTSERIAAYLERAPEPAADARNPFRFAERRSEASSPGVRLERGPASPAAGTAAPAVPVDLFPLSLVGLAEIAGDAPHHVAILTTRDALFHAVSGEMLLDRFTVGEVDAEGVEITDTVTGRVHRLRLR